MALIKGKQIAGWSTTGGKLESELADAGKALIVDATGEFQKVAITGDVAVDSNGDAQIQAGVVGTTELADTSVTTAKLGDTQVTTAKLADGSVVEAKLADEAVTLAKLAPALINTDLSASSDDQTLATSKAAKDYADSVAQGLDIKDSVKLLADANVDLASDLTAASIDGVALSAGDRILLTAQTTGSENGVYVVVAGAGNTLRSDDYPADYAAAGSFMFVEQGNTYQDTGWVCSSDNGSDVVGTDALTFTQFSAAGVVNAGTGLTKSGNDINVDLNTLPEFNGILNPQDGGENIVIIDSGDGSTRKKDIPTFVNAIRGAGLSSSNGRLYARQQHTQIKILAQAYTQGDNLGITFDYTPQEDQYPLIFVNGIQALLNNPGGSGGSFKIMNSTGAAQKSITDISTNDRLYWDTTDYDLEAGDVIQLFYNRDSSLDAV